MSQQPFDQDVAGGLEDLEATLIQPRKRRPTVWLLAAGKQRLPLFTHNILGRNPAIPAGTDGLESVEPIILHDPAKTVSKTHARIEVEDEGVWITDIGSTNGTFLTFESETGPARQVCEPGEDYEIREGDVITLGDFEVSIVRRTGP